VTGPRYRPRLLQTGQRWGLHVARLLLRLRVVGVEHIPARGPVLLVGNHTGILDGPLLVLTAGRPVRTLTKSEFFTGPLRRPLLAGGQIPLVRGRPDRAALRTALDELRGGGVVAIFPEGAIGPGQVEQFHHGVAWLALRSGALVVPVACTGTDYALPHGRWFVRVGAPVQIRYGAPLSLPPGPGARGRAGVSEAATLIETHLRGHVAAGAPGPGGAR
jgi:1-acyl-sn-glycerol-3-phosphate acyltransferase